MKKISLVITALVLALSFSGCSEKGGDIQPNNEENQANIVANVSNDEGSKEYLDKKLTLYVSGPEVMLNKLEEAFESERGDVIDMIIMSCGQVRSKVWTEQEAGNIQADIIWGSDPLIYNKLEEKKMLDKISIKDIDSIRGEYILEDKNYILVNERYITILYNKNDFKEEQLPSNYYDLLNESYKNMVVMADASQSSTALGIASSLYQINGIEYFEKLKENELFLTKSNGQVPSKILEGQFSLGIGPHDSVIRLKTKAKNEGYEMPVEIIWPKEGAIAIQRPLALVKDDTRTDNETKVANEFVNFMVSKKAQMITEKFGFVSVRKDIENKYLPDGQNVIKLDWERASQDEEELSEKYKEIFQK